MADATSRVRAVLRTELLVRQFSGGKIQFDVSSVLVLSRLDAWASLVLQDGVESALDRLPGTRTSDLAVDLVGAISEDMTSVAVSAEQNVLRKSIEETLYYIVRPDPELTRPQFELRLTHFLKARGPSSLVRMFLSLHVFNIVWLRTMLSFRQLAETDDALLRYMRDVERTCRRIVNGCWKSNQIQLPFADPFPAKLLESIEEQFQLPQS